MTITGFNGDTPSFNVDLRINEIKFRIQDLKEKMGVSEEVKLALDQFNKSPFAQLNKNIIKLPSWFLFKYDDIPFRFRITDLNDPRLGDQNYLNELANWMNEKFREAGLSSVIRSTDYGTLQTVIKFMRDRDLYEKSKDFTLGHELSHLNHFQVKQQTFYLSGMKDCTSIGGVIGGILLLFLAISIIPFVHLSITLVMGGIGVTACALGTLVWLSKTSPTALSSKIEEEKLADMDAVKFLHDASGGIYLFETCRQQNLVVRRHNPTQTSNIDENGNNLKDKNHPLLTERIAYLRYWQSQLPRPLL